MTNKNLQQNVIISEMNEHEQSNLYITALY